MIGIILPVVLTGLLTGLVHTQTLSCGGNGSFNGFIGVFERQTGKFAGYTPVCSEGTLNIGDDKNVPNHFPYQVQWFGQPWTVNSNDKYELRQANCPQGEVLKGFSEWYSEDGSAILGIRVVCSLSSAEFDYIIDLYQEQGKQIAQKNKPQVQKICFDMIDAINFEAAGVIKLAENIQCRTDQMTTTPTPSTPQPVQQITETNSVNTESPNQFQYSQTSSAPTMPTPKPTKPQKSFNNHQNTAPVTEDFETSTLDDSSKPQKVNKLTSKPSRRMQPPKQDSPENYKPQMEGNFDNPPKNNNPSQAELVEYTRSKNTATNAGDVEPAVEIDMSSKPVKNQRRVNKLKDTSMVGRDAEPSTEESVEVSLPISAKPSRKPRGRESPSKPQELAQKQEAKPKKTRKQKDEKSPEMIKSSDSSTSGVHPQYLLLQQRKSPAIPLNNAPISEVDQSFSDDLSSPSLETSAPTGGVSSVIQTTHTTVVSSSQLQLASPQLSAQISAPVETIINVAPEDQNAPAPAPAPTPTPTPPEIPSTSAPVRPQRLVSQPNVPVGAIPSEQ